MIFFHSVEYKPVSSCVKRTVWFVKYGETVRSYKLDTEFLHSATLTRTLVLNSQDFLVLISQQFYTFLYHSNQIVYTEVNHLQNFGKLLYDKCYYNHVEKLHFGPFNTLILLSGNIKVDFGPKRNLFH